MLSTPTRPATAPPSALPTGRPVRVEIRQRRATATLLTLTVGLAVAALATASAALWSATVVAGALTGGYLALVARVRHLSAQREMSAAFAVDPAFDWDEFGRSIADAALVAESDGPTSTVSLDNRELARFVAAWALGMALTPVVGVIRVAGGDLGDLQGHAVVAKLVRAQAYGRSQSLRVVAAGLVATAGVATVGAVVAGGAASAAPAVVTATGGHYTVRAGDTLVGIAHRFGVTVASLASANSVSDANLIQVGQVLVIPAAGSPGASTAHSAGTHTVVAGDTLSALALRYSTTVAELARANHIANPNVITVGEHVVLAGGRAPAVSTTLTATGTYTVRAGDTLSAIAARYGTSVSTLAALNHLSGADSIAAGAVLEVVGTPSSDASQAPALSGTGTYTVRAGDTLSAIAARYGTSVSTLAALNHLSGADSITVGAVLQVVGTPSSARSAPTAPAVTAPSSARSTPADSSTAASSTAGSSTAGSSTAASSTAGSSTAASSTAGSSTAGSTGAGTSSASGTGSTSPAPGSGSTSTAPGSSASSGESAAAAVAVKVALEQVGKPYVYGGAGPDSFDCSGLVMYAYEAAGISLPHNAASQYEVTTHVSESQLVPGDLVFYDNYDGPQPGHVAMYIGGGQVVAANQTGTNVQTQSIGYDGTIIGFGRVG